MKARYEEMLEAIANGLPITIEPTCRLERFLKAYANKEDVSVLPEPICREEEYWLSLIKGETIFSTPQCKREEYIKAIANKETMPDTPIFGREELLFRQILANAGGSGGEIEDAMVANEILTLISNHAYVSDETLVFTNDKNIDNEILEVI